MDFIPEFIMIQIFQNLDQKSIKKASTVCRRWQEIICGASVLINRFETTFNMKDSKKLAASIKDLEIIPYKKVDFRPNFYQDQRLLQESIKAIKQHANHIEEVTFFRASRDTILHIVGALWKDKITSLTIVRCYEEHIFECISIHLPNLKTLAIHQGSRMLKMIKTHRIETLNIFIGNEYRGRYDEEINKFLISCPKLKTLFFDCHVPIIEAEKMEFNLTHLYIANSESDQITLCLHQLDSLKNLIATNADTIEEINLGNYRGVDGLLEFMLPRVTKLNSLTFIKSTFKRIQSITKNRTIISLASAFSNVQKMRQIIQGCPAVEKLTLNCLSHDATPVIREAALSLSNLKELHICSPKGRLANQVPPLTNLEILNIRRIDTQNDVKPLVNLVMAAPMLKKLRIDFWVGKQVPNLSKRRLKKLLSTCTELEKIYIGGRFRLSNSFVEGLLEAGSNLKSVTFETDEMDVAQANARKLLNTKIQCTILKWNSQRINEEEEFDSDFEYDSDYDVYDPYEDHEFFEYLNDQIGDDGSSSDEDNAFDDNDDDREVRVDPEDRINEIDDRFDEMGRRRSKRLRLMR